MIHDSWFLINYVTVIILILIHNWDELEYELLNLSIVYCYSL